MSSGTLILAYSWQNGVTMIAVAIALTVAAFVLRHGIGADPMRLLGTLGGCAFAVWMGAHMLTSYTQVDTRGVTAHAPVHPLKRNTFIPWNEMAMAEIVPCGWNVQGLRLVSRTGAEIVIPLDEMRNADIKTLVGLVATRPSVRMQPDAATLIAHANRIVPRRDAPRLRAAQTPDRIASAAR